MSWIEGFRERERRRVEVQRQEAARNSERQRIEAEKYRKNGDKNLARLIKRYTGRKIEPPQIAQITSRQESGNNWVSETSINGMVQVDGSVVWNC